jgi:hypothetical protein
MHATPTQAVPLHTSCALTEDEIEAAIRRADIHNLFGMKARRPSRVYCRRLPEPWAPWERIAKGAIGDAVVVKVTTKPLLDALRSIPADFVSLSSEGGDSGLCLDYTTPTGRGRLVVDASMPKLPPIRHRVRYLVDALACCGDETTMMVSASAAAAV